jgi:EpsI family protein
MKCPPISLPFAGTLLILATTLAASGITAYRKPSSLVRPLDTISRRIAGFDAIDNPAISEGVLRELKPTSYLSRTYRKSDIAADLFIAFYARQRAGESMHSPKNCLPGAGWEIWNFGSLEIPVNKVKFKVNRYSISRESTRMVVLYWYQSQTRIVASEYWGKLLLAKDALFQENTAASIVRIIVPDQSGTVEQASAFASELIPQVQQCFGK